MACYVYTALYSILWLKDWLFQVVLICLNYSRQDVNSFFLNFKVEGETKRISAGAKGVLLHGAWHPVTNWGFLPLKDGRFLAAMAVLVDLTQIKHNVGVLILARWVCERGSCSCHRGRSAMCTVCVFPYVCVCVWPQKDLPGCSKKDPSASRAGPSLPSFPLPSPHTLQTST